MGERIYKDRDNPITLILQEDDEAITETQMLAITKVAVRYSSTGDRDDGVYYDSDSYPTLFNWTTYADEAKIVMKLGTILPVGRDHRAELIIYNVLSSNGIVWDQISIQVSEEAEAD